MNGFERGFCCAVLLGAAAAMGCGGSSELLGLGGGGDGSGVTLQFQSYCTNPVTTWETNSSGSECTEVGSSVTPVTASSNAYSASTTGSGECGSGTRVEITPGTDGDVSYDISTNAGTSGPVFYNVPVQFLALQNTAPSPCALPVWDGGMGPTDLRGVSSAVCDDATCPTAYQTSQSGPQFITRADAASTYVAEWCPDDNTSPIPTCPVPTLDTSNPCPYLCWADVVQAPLPCYTQSDKTMCDVAPFGGTPPESYCLLTTDCTNDGQACPCCRTDTDCDGGSGTCTNFVCS
ncbi:MAG: hypothetical protein FJ144_22335 [Deltaproteobacteria bacterium]|nr:hypothetical protein [Deltaproteobacteria bacterium]